ASGEEGEPGCAWRWGSRGDEGRQVMLRKALVLFVVFVAVVLVGAGDAGAALPAPMWRITSLSTPTSFSASDVPGKDVYLVKVTNVGDAPSDGTPITVSDTLPSGFAYDPSGGL